MPPEALNPKRSRPRTRAREGFVGADGAGIRASGGRKPQEDISSVHDFVELR